MAPGSDPSGRRLLLIGAAVSGLAAAAYLAALLSHPASALLDGYDLRVYLGGGTVARQSPADLYVWHYRDTPSIQFLYTPFAAMVFAALSFVPWQVLNDVMTIADVAAVGVTVWPARLAWSAAALLLALAFAGWPSFWNAGQGHGLTWYAPATPFASGDNPGYLEYHWRGIQLLDGNLYVLIGCALLLAAMAPIVWARRRQERRLTCRSIQDVPRSSLCTGRSTSSSRRASSAAC